MEALCVGTSKLLAELVFLFYHQLIFIPMLYPSDGVPGSVNADFADYLCEHKQDIIGDWRDRVRADAAIKPSKSLNTVALTNRLPHIFDDLSLTLRSYRSTLNDEQAVRDVREHSATRWRQGYELSDVLREIKHLRSILIYHLNFFESSHPGNGMAANLFVSTIVHRFLDEMVIETTEEFLWAQLALKDDMHRRREQKLQEES